MKKLLVLVVLAVASLANAVILDLSSDLDMKIFSIGIAAPGMSGAADGTGVYFAITGVVPASGVLTAAAAPLTLSSANYGDIGDTGLFAYGLGTYGEFRATNVTYSVGAGIYATDYMVAPGAKEVTLFTLDSNFSQATVVETFVIPEPATMGLLALGGLLFRKK